ncbi:hypothetical protein K491DRAFT_388715 [Lophiostoma macrostomum CBS 122681]|uniref:LITAF domain-containing protein n=1 Tax=Lophiostoma macrostomum CBS 122681 TaxID=1314788 RepID=A0A6A6TSB2_9PLEO|nr:hypothetical protein K491DRAFT_388715 [Lophiostoma macrostomum CBS 122681]
MPCSPTTLPPFPIRLGYKLLGVLVPMITSLLNKNEPLLECPCCKAPMYPYPRESNAEYDARVLNGKMVKGVMPFVHEIVRHAKKARSAVNTLKCLGACVKCCCCCGCCGCCCGKEKGKGKGREGEKEKNRPVVRVPSGPSVASVGMPPEVRAPTGSPAPGMPMPVRSATAPAMTTGYSGSGGTADVSVRDRRAPPGPGAIQRTDSGLSGMEKARGPPPGPGAIQRTDSGLSGATLGTTAGRPPPGPGSNGPRRVDSGLSGTERARMVQGQQPAAGRSAPAISGSGSARMSNEMRERESGRPYAGGNVRMETTVSGGYGGQQARGSGGKQRQNRL